MSDQTPPPDFMKELPPGQEPNPVHSRPRVAPRRRISENERVWTMVETNQDEVPVMKKWWRPWMAFQYILVCLFDFIIAPSLTMMFFQGTEEHYVQWSPLTLQNGGIYHLSMGAVLGIYVWSRGQEKLNNKDL